MGKVSKVFREDFILFFAIQYYLQYGLLYSLSADKLRRILVTWITGDFLAIGMHPLLHQQTVLDVHVQAVFVCNLRKKT